MSWNEVYLVVRDRERAVREGCAGAGRGAPRVRGRILGVFLDAGYAVEARPSLGQLGSAGLLGV